MNRSIEALAEQAAARLMNGAAQYILSNRLKPTEQALKDVTAAIKAKIGAAVEEGMKDANAALDARMERVALATFATTMTLAGISAAKEVFGAQEKSFEERVAALEAEGLSTSDAQAVIDAQDLKAGRGRQA